MKKVIMFIGRFVRLALILTLFVIFLIQGLMYLDEICSGLIPLLKTGEIWRFVFECELFLAILVGVLLALLPCMVFIFISLMSLNSSTLRYFWISLFWEFSFLK